MGGTKPKFSEDVNFKGISREIAKSVTLTCPAQSYPTPAFRSVLGHKLKKVTFLEPIGGSKPQFSEDSNYKRISRIENEAMALLCPAQGYPQPSFRSILKKKIVTPHLGPV